MLRKISYSLIATFMSCSVWAQAPADTAKAAAPAPPALSITGSADVYYRYNFDKQVNSPTSFTQSHNQARLGMASVKLEHKTDKVDMVADLGFGQRAKDFAYNDDGITQAIKQLYISYTFNKYIKVTGGTWATHIGYEVLDAYANRNYSMSYMFTNGPFSHTGLKADLTFGKSGFMVGVSNPTDFRAVPEDGKNNKNIIAQYSFAPNDNYKFYLNFVGGKDVADNKIYQYDLVATGKLSSLLSLGINGTLNKSKYADDDYATSHTWSGGALYVNLDPAPWFGLTLRGEYFSDKDHIKIASDKVIAGTLSAQFKKDGFIFIPEFRYDHGNTTDMFLKSDGITGTKGTASFLIAAIYSF
jgi:hypothetical protein